MRELLAIVVAIVGTIVLGVIAAHNISVANDPESSASLGFSSLVTALLAVGFFLINVWHIVGLTVLPVGRLPGDGLDLPRPALPVRNLGGGRPGLDPELSAAAD